jgi:acyl-CoA dehydrogenase
MDEIVSRDLVIVASLSTEDAATTKMIGSDLEGDVLDECVRPHGGAGTNKIMKEIIGRGLGLDERKMT